MEPDSLRQPPPSPPAPPALSPDELAFASAATGQDLLDRGYVLVDYLVETTDDPWKAALHLCRETSTALWRRREVDEDYRPRHGALLTGLEVLEVSDQPHAPWPAALPPAPRFTRARIRVAHPMVNFGTRLPNLLTAIAGEGTYFTPDTPFVCLEDISFPDEFLAAFTGPRFGVEGLRAVLDVRERPLICGVVKPNIGMEPHAFAEIAGQGLEGGADIVKDDEMLADVAYSPTRLRARLTFERVRQAAARTGEHKLYLVNITDEVDRLLELHEMVHEIGGTHGAIMLNALPVGLSACRMVARHTRMPMFAHFDVIAAASRLPWHGISSLAMTRLQRLAGFDAIIMPGLGARMAVRREDVVRDVKACLEPMGSIAPSLPLPGGSDWAGSLLHLWEALGTRDFGIIPGRGIFGHPSGPAAGARSIRDAWTAISTGIHPRDYATSSSALAEAYSEFDR